MTPRGGLLEIRYSIAVDHTGYRTEPFSDPCGEAIRKFYKQQSNRAAKRTAGRGEDTIMINMIQQAKRPAAELTLRAYQAAAAAGKLPDAPVNKAPVEIPKDHRNGDFTTTFRFSCS